jgi:hypothetical protein
MTLDGQWARGQSGWSIWEKRRLGNEVWVGRWWAIGEIRGVDLGG